MTIQETQAPEIFAERLVEMLNHASITVMISLGHKLGLFDAMEELETVAPHELADNTGCSERYIREWLSVMVTAKIMHFDPADNTFTLPSNHAMFLCRKFSPDNIAVTSQFIPIMGQMVPHLEQCFRTGEGLQYSDYPCFHSVMAEDSFQTVVYALFDQILPLMPDVSEKLQSGIRVLDAGCGKGLALLKMAQEFPNSYFVGYDLCGDAFEETVEQARFLRLTNIEFVAQDMQNFKQPESFDLITSFDAVHDQADPQGLLDSIFEALKPGGTYLMQDIAGSSYLENNLKHPLGPLIYSISCTHCTPVSLGQNGPGLGTMWGEELATSMLQCAGFSKIEKYTLEHDPFNVYFINRKS
ncbi:class I SAM-dependent methyltransferase [Kangiella sp. M94]